MYIQISTMIAGNIVGDEIRLYRPVLFCFVLFLQKLARDA